METYITDLIVGTNVAKAILLACCLNGLDVAFGIVKALYLEEFKSNLVRKGLLKKSTWVIMYAAGAAVYICTGMSTASSVLAYTFAIAAIISELGSMLESARDMGLNIKLTKFLADKEGEDE